jgi:hypothetical protein
MYAYKYSNVKNFFYENYYKFIPQYDFSAISSDPKKKLFIDALMRQFDKFSSIIADISDVVDIDNVDENYLDYLAQLLGYERVEQEIVSNLTLRELVKNITEVYKIKGTNYSFDLFFSLLGFDVTIKEYWFDKRMNDAYLGVNPETGESSKLKRGFYFTSTKPTDFFLSGLTKNTFVSELEIKDTMDLDLFELYTNANGDNLYIYDIDEVLGNTNVYDFDKFTYFKTNYVEFSFTKISKDGQSAQLTPSEIIAIRSYVDFLTPIFVERNLIAVIKPFIEDFREVFSNQVTKNFNDDNIPKYDSNNNLIGSLGAFKEIENYTNLNPEGNYFAIGGTNGSVQQMYSKNMIDWTIGNSALPNLPKKVIYGKNVYVSLNGSNDSYFSHNGSDWKLIKGLVKDFSPINYYYGCFGNGKFVIADGTGKIAISNNGIDWQESYAAVTVGGVMEYLNGKYVSALGVNYASSTDGGNWVGSNSLPNNTWNSIFYANSNYYLIGGPTVTGQTYYSSDATTWSLLVTSVTNILPTNKTWFGNYLTNAKKFVATASDSTTPYYSTNGIDWYAGSVRQIVKTDLTQLQKDARQNGIKGIVDYSYSETTLSDVINKLNVSYDKVYGYNGTTSYISTNGMVWYKSKVFSSIVYIYYANQIKSEQLALMSDVFGSKAFKYYLKETDVDFDQNLATNRNQTFYSRSSEINVRQIDISTGNEWFFVLDNSYNSFLLPYNTLVPNFLVLDYLGNALQEVTIKRAEVFGTYAKVYIYESLYQSVLSGNIGTAVYSIVNRKMNDGFHALLGNYLSSDNRYLKTGAAHSDRFEYFKYKYGDLIENVIA